MSGFEPRDRRFLESVAALGYCNPFLPERIQLEKKALGRDFVDAGPVWSSPAGDPTATSANVLLIFSKLQDRMPEWSNLMAAAVPAVDTDVNLYEDVLQYFLYQRYYADFVAAGRDYSFYRRYLAEWRRLWPFPDRSREAGLTPAHTFACFRQIQRAFHHIYDNIIGTSMAAANLRASVWQSVFTHDMRRYRRALFPKMGDFPTLITGPSGTGKELIARAIAGSRYIPFDEGRLQFADPRDETFLPVNVAALSPALVESELFGHRRGSFTGAIADRKGWLEACPAAGSVFLDELGEMDLAIQVKLLRVIETRRFSAVGETAARPFQGKLLAATNRDLPSMIRNGRFREDLYYRLCADLIQTPSLAEQIAGSPEALHELVRYMTVRTVGDEAERCLPEVQTWIAEHLPRNYSWPGNYRELEQCVRNIVIRRSYRPLADAPTDAGDDLLRRFRDGAFTASELLDRYAAQVYQLTGSYEEAARRLELDRRTVKTKVEAFLSRYTASVN